MFCMGHCLMYRTLGNADSDHACWMRPEDMTTSRPSYRIDAQHPGADLAGETVAAMAAASLAFQTSDAVYAKTLIDHAKNLFEFGKHYPEVYQSSIPNAGGFYPSSGYKDELLWAVAWLHRATGDESYLDYLTQVSGNGGARYVFVWDDKFLGAQVLVAKMLSQSLICISKLNVLENYHRTKELLGEEILHSETVDLTGGYYDAGDNMKFGFPMAFTTTMLAWSSIEMASQLKAHNEYGNVLAALKWSTDYLIKAHPQPNVLYGKVGDGKSDHACWMRPEDMTTPRPSYRIDAQLPGADLAGETVAAMVFASSDKAYGVTLIRHAKELFEFAKAHPGLYQTSIPNAGGFYASSGYQDELLWAAFWLHRATNDHKYLDYLILHASGSGGPRTVFSWDDKFVGVQVLVAKLTLEKNLENSGKIAEYKRMAEQFICNCAQKGSNNVKKTSGGLLWFLPWNNLQYTASASFVLSAYSKYLEAGKSSIQCPNGVLHASDLLR